MVFVTLAFCSALSAAALIENRETDLAAAISVFNENSEHDRIGSNQSPLTEVEVIAAIRLWEKPADAPVSDALLAQFKSIATTRILPQNAEFAKLTGYDRGGEYVFDVWSVRIRIERPDKSSFAFVIRERVVASRTLPEELERYKSQVKGTADSERLPGWYRIENRICELEERIARSSR